MLAKSTEKRIDQTVAGEKVWAVDPETGEAGPRKVTAVIVGSGTKDLVDVRVETGGDRATVTATSGHPFWVPSVRKWLAAAALVVGMVLATADGGTTEVAATHAYAEPHRVYNLTVDDLHTYFVTVGDEEVLVHNSNDPTRPVKVPKTGGKPGSTDAPSWVKNEGYVPYAREFGSDFSKRAMDGHYGQGNWENDPNKVSAGRPRSMATGISRTPPVRARDPLASKDCQHVVGRKLAETGPTGWDPD